jgi:hypothetical protein
MGAAVSTGDPCQNAAAGWHKISCCAALDDDLDEAQRRGDRCAHGCPRRAPRQHAVAATVSEAVAADSEEEYCGFPLWSAVHAHTEFVVSSFRTHQEGCSASSAAGGC